MIEDAVEEKPEPCPKCGGRTVEFTGTGKITQYRICPWRDKPGHKTKDEVAQEITCVRQSIVPSGRMA